MYGVLSCLPQGSVNVNVLFFIHPILSVVHLYRRKRFGLDRYLSVSCWYLFKYAPAICHVLIVVSDPSSLLAVHEWLWHCRDNKEEVDGNSKDQLMGEFCLGLASKKVTWPQGSCSPATSVLWQWLSFLPLCNLQAYVLQFFVLMLETVFTGFSSCLFFLSRREATPSLYVVCFGCMLSTTHTSSA